MAFLAPTSSQPSGSIWSEEWDGEIPQMDDARPAVRVKDRHEAARPGGGHCRTGRRREAHCKEAVMDRRMLAIGAATIALAAVGCGDSNDPTDNAAQAAPVTKAPADEVDATTGTEGGYSSPYYGDQSEKDKTLYFNRSDASQR
jgi:hypothetical protein